MTSVLPARSRKSTVTVVSPEPGWSAAASAPPPGRGRSRVDRHVNAPELSFELALDVEAPALARVEPDDPHDVTGVAEPAEEPLGIRPGAEHALPGRFEDARDPDGRRFIRPGHHALSK